MTTRRGLSPAAGRVFRRRLLAWYDRNQRDLPWRKDGDPYRIWLSEVMLQQTRVAAVVEYYQRFLRRFPTVQKLAAARQSSVLAAWSGLGYYRRARMLHAAAKQVARRGGRFPATAAELRTLPGIGRYTAAAIASIAFGEPVAVVDGNVERVLERRLGRELAGEETWQAARDLLDPRRPGDSNQAMMELGATICLPRQPACAICPVPEGCALRGNLQRSASAPRQRKREIHYVLDRRNSTVRLVRRPESASLMPGMWELPETDAGQGEPWLTVRHSITLTDYTVRVQLGTAPEIYGEWVAEFRLKALPLTGLARKILRAAELL